MLKTLLRHAYGIVVVLVIIGWILFYLPGTPSYAVFQVKRAIDAHDGRAAAQFIDFPSVVKNAGYQMVQDQAASGDVVSALVGKGVVDLLSQPTAAALEQWAERKVDDGAKEVQMPIVAVAGALFYLHRSGNTASTEFRDGKGQLWRIHMARNDKRWQIVSVDNIQQLLGKLQHQDEKKFNQAP